MGYVVVPDEMDDHELVYAAIAGAGRSLGYVNAPGDVYKRQIRNFINNDSVSIFSVICNI